MAGSEGRDPLDDYKKINHELESYSDQLTFKHRLVVANKMDLPAAKKNMTRFKKKFETDVMEVSALEKQGLEVFVESLVKILHAEKISQTN